MPENAAERLANALERMRDRTLSEGEHEVAVEAFVKANQEMLDKMGVERRPSSSVRTGQAIAVVLIIAVVLSMVLNLSFSVTASSTAEKANDTSEEVRHQATKLRMLQRGNILAQRENCERSNDARVASIKEKRQSVRSLGKQLAFWDAALEASKDQPPSPLTGVFLTFVGGLEEELATKREGITSSIESQASVAIKPGSPRADCAKANPLPGEKRPTSP